MLVSVFNAVLIIAFTWLAFRYLDLKERNAPVEQRYSQFISGIASIIDRAEGYDKNHAAEVAEIAEEIALAAGVSEEQLQALKAAAMLHDAGELLLPREIFRNSTKLNDEQIFLMRTHPLLGELHLKNNMTAPDEVPAIIRWHHERWDGLGYPDNLKGEEIPLPARILALADAVSAMRNARAYRQKKYEDGLEINQEIRRQAGLQFDPELVNIWLKISDTQN
jgi:HD-GYP domain-containing protein (c-di-GMP phosphodiesterase class II)